MAQQAENQPTPTSAIDDGRSADQRHELKQTARNQAWYFVRRWPVLPPIIMLLLLFAGIFAPFEHRF